MSQSKLIGLMPLNAQIARALGWSVWDVDGKWFAEGPSEKPGHIEVILVPDYMALLRDDPTIYKPRGERK